MYLIASEYEKAVEPAQRAAELSDSGDGYDTLGYIQYVRHDYEAAVVAFQAALDKGNLTNRADTLLFLARALVELDRFDEAAAAARQSAEAGDGNDREAANNYLKFVNDSKSRYTILKDRRDAAQAFYRGYPPIQ